MENRNFAGNLQISKVNKWYPGDVHAVKDMDMEIKRGEFIVFVGPSGCGKTTLLRMIAGLESISSGEVIMDGRIVNKVPPKNRDIAMVFQNYALYPNMKVKDNIAFPLKMQHIGKQEREGRVAEVAQKLELDDLLERKPGALSGGQRQRVALARAMIRKPGDVYKRQCYSYAFTYWGKNKRTKGHAYFRKEIQAPHRRPCAAHGCISYDWILCIHVSMHNYFPCIVFLYYRPCFGSFDGRQNADEQG